MNLVKFCASSVALLFLCSCDNSDVSLAFNTANAPVQKFTLESSMNVFAPQDSATPNPESMETHLYARSTLVETVAFDNGSGRFEMKIDSVDYKSDKRSVEDYRYVEKYLSSQHFQFKMTTDGVISDPAVEDVALQPGSDELNLMKLFMKVQPVLPGNPVKLGEAWERPVEIPGNGSTTTVYKSFKLEDVFVSDGVQMAKVAMNVKYKEVADTTSTVRMESSDFIVGTGSILFDVTHGVIVSGSIELSGHVNIHDMIASEMLQNMYVVQKIKLRGELE